MVNAHEKAWKQVEGEIFGNVLEVTRRTPWGFKEDRKDIVNVTVDEFLKSDTYYDTIILHILAGEGEPIGNVFDCIEHAEKLCLKLIVLEHDPIDSAWQDSKLVKQLLIDSIEDAIICSDVYWDYHINRFGRNMIIAATTLSHFNLSELNDEWYNKRINQAFVSPRDKGIDKNNLIYTHTSECDMSEEEYKKVPKDKPIYSVIGGQAYLNFIYKEGIEQVKLIDPILSQCIYARYCLEEDKQDKTFKLKIGSLYPIQALETLWTTSPVYQEQGGNEQHWYNIAVAKAKGIPDALIEIECKSLQDLDVENSVVYISTVERRYWEHLIEKNCIIDSLTNRDVPEVMNNAI